MHEGVVKEDEFRLPEICVKKHNKNTPEEKELIESVSTGKINKMYDLLWHENVSVNVKKDYYGSDLLSLATQNEQNDIVKLLMKMSLEPNNSRNSYGVTPVHWAASNGNDYLIKELYKNGLSIRDLEKRDEFGSTPLHFAALKNNEAVVHLLISCGINPTVINNDGKRASDVTTDLTLKKFLKEKEIRYMAEHFQKRGRRKGKKNRNKNSHSQRKSISSTSTISKKSSISKQSSMVRSFSTKRNSMSSSSGVMKPLPSPQRKRSEPENHILPPTINNNRTLVSSPPHEKTPLNPTSYAMKNINKEIITLKTKSPIQKNLLKGSKRKPKQL